MSRHVNRLMTAKHVAETQSDYQYVQYSDTKLRTVQYEHAMDGSLAVSSDSLSLCNNDLSHYVSVIRRSVGLSRQVPTQHAQLRGKERHRACKGPQQGAQTSSQHEKKQCSNTDEVRQEPSEIMHVIV